MPDAMLTPPGHAAGVAQVSAVGAPPGAAGTAGVPSKRGFVKGQRAASYLQS